MDDVTIPLTAKADNTILDPASMVATISNFTTTGMDDFTVTPLGVLSDGTNLAMVLNLAPNQPDMLPEETMFIIDVCSLNIDNKPLSELLSSESLNTVTLGMVWMLSKWNATVPSVRSSDVFRANATSACWFKNASICILQVIV